MFLGIANAISGIKSGGLSFIKDNLKLYLDFKSSKSDTLKFPCEGSTAFTDTTGQYIDCGVQIATDMGGSFNTSFTVSFWLYRTVTNNNCGIFYIGTFANANGKVQIYTSNDILKFRINNVDQLDIADFSSDNSGWNHIALTWNASTTTSIVYVNGVSQTPKTNSESSIAFTSSMKTIIGNYYGTGFPLNGKMANVGLWTRDLSLEEINSVMRKNYSQLKSVEKTSLVSWWALDSASNTNGAVDSQTETLGTEKITNGGFDADSDWTKSSVTISGGKANFSSGGSTALYQDIGSSLTGLYKVTFEVTDYTSGTLDVYGGGQDSFGDTELLTVNAVGSYTAYIILVGSFNGNIIFGGGSFTGSIDNVSVKEVTSGNTGVITGATTTTSVYGGNAPVLPRSVDVGREGEAEAIGNGSASFDGSSDYIQTANNVNITGAMSRSFTFWANPTATDQYYELIEWGGTGSANATCGLYLYSSKIFFYGWGAGDFDTGVAPLSEWQHLAVTYDGTTVKVYQNGILLGSSSESLNTANTVLKIGNSQGNEFSGNMSQVGVWAGALTQAQIQSVMESTSYAKIPADVKSTLGSELVDSNVASSWTDNSDGSTITNITGGVSIADDSSYSDLGKLNNAGLLSTDLTLGKLYKVQFDSYHNGTGTPSLRIKDGSANQIIDVTSSNATYIRYIHANTNVNEIMFRTQDNESGSVVYLTNVSVKEVTNDLVGYWGLDESANGVIQDSTTGETTTSVVNRDFAGVAHGSDPLDLSYIYAYGSPGEKVIDTERIKIVNSSNTGVYWNESGLTASKLYKITIDATGDVASGGVYNGSITFTLSDGTFTAYKTGITALGATYLRANDNSSGTTYYDNLKIEEVTSNTGVLL